jgi:magnesium transporter
MQEIELSSRLYQENGALFMTATLVTKVDTQQPESHAVTFILTDRCLVTIRYIDPQPFRVFSYRSERQSIVDRIADVLEKVGHNIDNLIQSIFRHNNPHLAPNAEKPDFQEILQHIATNGDVVSKTRESMVSILRLITFLNQAMTAHASSDVLIRINTVNKDLTALGDHASFLSNKVNFLLDATLGMIGIEQNNIIKIFSVAAVVFLPPTLIASIYGMNFHTMPELDWPFGYPLAVVLMVLSAYLPYRFFKGKGWL